MTESPSWTLGPAVGAVLALAALLFGLRAIDATMASYFSPGFV